MGCCRFGFFTDPHNNTVRTQVAVNLFNATPDIQFAIECGDFIEGGWVEWPAQLAAEEAVYNDLVVPRHYVFGNHCTTGPTKALFIANTGRRADKYYSFDVAGNHFVVLDTQYIYGTDTDGIAQLNGYIGPNQRAWLTADLAAGAGPAYVFSHQNLFHAVGGYGAVTNAAEVRAIMQASGRVRACFCGHHNTQEVTMWSGIWYLTSMTMNYSQSYALMKTCTRHGLWVLGYGSHYSLGSDCGCTAALGIAPMPVFLRGVR